MGVQSARSLSPHKRRRAVALASGHYESIKMTAGMSCAKRTAYDSVDGSSVWITTPTSTLAHRCRSRGRPSHQVKAPKRPEIRTHTGEPTNGLSLMFPQAPDGAIRPLGFRARGRGAQSRSAVLQTIFNPRLDPFWWRSLGTPCCHRDACSRASTDGHGRSRRKKTFPKDKDRPSHQRPFD